MRSEQRYAQSAEWYDRVYAAMGKDYAAEAAVLDAIVRARCPSARTLLDAGCGTGRHLEQLAVLDYEIAGFDLHPGFVRRARERCRGARIVEADLCTVDVGRRFDAVTCLFGAIAHVETTDRLDAAIARLAAHLAPDGVLILEPWRAVEDVRDGETGSETVTLPGATLTRHSRTSSDGSITVIEFDWLERFDSGVERRERETLRLARFTADEYRAAFARAGLDARFDEAGLWPGSQLGAWIAQLAP